MKDASSPISSSELLWGRKAMSLIYPGASPDPALFQQSEMGTVDPLSLFTSQVLGIWFCSLFLQNLGYEVTKFETEDLEEKKKEGKPLDSRGACPRQIKSVDPSDIGSSVSFNPGKSLEAKFVFCEGEPKFKMLLRLEKKRENNNQASSIFDLVNEGFGLEVRCASTLEKIRDWPWNSSMDVSGVKEVLTLALLSRHLPFSFPRKPEGPTDLVCRGHAPRKPESSCPSVSFPDLENETGDVSEPSDLRYAYLEIEGRINIEKTKEFDDQGEYVGPCFVIDDGNETLANNENGDREYGSFWEALKKEHSLSLRFPRD